MNNDIENLQDAYDALKRIHILANETNEKLIIENNLLRAENAYLKSLNGNADKNVEIQKMIVVNSLKSSQEKHERDYQEIMILKEEIRNLKANK